MTTSTKSRGLESIKKDFFASILSDLEEAIGDMTYDQILDSEIYQILMEYKASQKFLSRQTIKHKHPTSWWFFVKLFRSATKSQKIDELQKRIILDEPQIIFSVEHLVSNVFISESILQFMIDNEIIDRAINETLIPDPVKYCRTTLLQSASNEQAIYMKMRWNI